MEFECNGTSKTIYESLHTNISFGFLTDKLFLFLVNKEKITLQ
jgi:hypothetical protein